MQSGRPITRWLATLVLVVCLPMAQLATSWAGTTVCCCGEHAADHDCGCPDCPSTATDDEYDQGDQDSETPAIASLGACSRGMAAVGAHASSMHMLLVPPIAIMTSGRNVPPFAKPTPLTTRTLDLPAPSS